MFYTAGPAEHPANEGARVPLHNVDETEEHRRAREETSSSSSDNEVGNLSGTWGERDIGGPVNLRTAMLEYEEMRRELTQLSKTRSARSAKTDKSQPTRSGLGRMTTGASQASGRSPVAAEPQHNIEDIEQQEKPEISDEEEDFELSDFLKDGFFEKRQEGKSAKKVGVVYKNLTVEGVGATTTFVKTLPGAIMGVSPIPLWYLHNKTNQFW